MSQDKSKRQEIKPVSVKPSLSEMFLEATNQLRGTELSPEDIRNYTLSRYNVDVIKCMKDINMLTRFSEIKLPNVTSRKYSKKCSQRRSVKAKSVRRVATKKSKRTNLNKSKRVVSKRKVVKSKKSHRSTTAIFRTKSSKLSCVRNNTSENEQMKSRISLIRLIRNRSSIGKDNERNFSRGESNASAKHQLSHLGNKKVVSDTSKKDDSNATAECKANGTITSSLGDSTVRKRDANSTSEEDVKIRFRDYPGRKNESTDKRDSLKSENKILKAGYAVKNFIEDLGTKCASSLMFNNQRRFDKSNRNHDDRMEEVPMYHKLRKVKIDLVQDNRKTGADCSPGDAKSTTVLGSKNDQTNKGNHNVKSGNLQGDRNIPLVGIKTDVQDVQNVVLANFDSGESSAKTDLTLQTISTNEKAAKKMENFTQLPRNENFREEGTTKVQQSVPISTEVTKSEIARSKNVTKQTRFGPDSENGRKSANTNSRRPILKSKRKSKEIIRLFQNERKFNKTISKRKTRNIRNAKNFGKSRIKKKTVKRTNPRVKFADDCGEKYSPDTLQPQASILKNGRKAKSNRIEKLENLLVRRRIKKKVKQTL